MKRSGLTFTLRFLALAATCSIAVSKPLTAQGFTLEQVLSNPFPTQLTAARQGTRIAWVFSQRGAQNIWVADVSGSDPRQITKYSGDTGEPIASLRLTPDGRSAIYARGTELNGEGRSANPLSEPKQPKQQVWIISVEGGEPRLLGEMGCEFEGCEDIQISPDGKWAVWEAKHELWIVSTIAAAGSSAKQLTDLRGSVGSPQWSPDGKHLVVAVGRGDHSFTEVLDLADGTLQGVHVVAPSTDRDMAPQWSPDGTEIAFLRVGGVEEKRPLIPMRTRPWSLWVADARTYTAASIWKSGTGMRDSLPPFGPSQLLFAAGGRIVFSSEADNRNHLYSISSKGGQATLLTPGEYDVEEAVLSTDTRSVLLSSNENDIDRRHVWQVSATGGAPPVALARGDTIEWLPVPVGDGKSVVCLGSTATTPALVYRLANGARELITKSALPAEFPSAQLVTPSQVVFTSSDGVTVHGQLFSPKGQTKPGPALIFTHGGPPRQMLLGFHYMDYYSNAYAANQYLASLGFTVLSVNYRLGIMYGHDFREAPNTSWRGAAEYNDVLAGAHYLQKLPTVDPKRIGLWGGSYGGYLTALGLARNSDVFAAGVDYHGVHDWADFLPDWEEGAHSAPDYKEAEKLAFSSSPNAAIDQWRSPVLLVQGDDDRNVPFSQTVSLVQKLRSRGVPFELIVFPDEIHDFLLWKDFVTAYSATAVFFQKNLR